MITYVKTKLFSELTMLLNSDCMGRKKVYSNTYLTVHYVQAFGETMLTGHIVIIYNGLNFRLKFRSILFKIVATKTTVFAYVCISNL